RDPRAVQPRAEEGRLRRIALGRPAQAPRDGPRPHDRPGHDHARRAHGRCEPCPGPVAARAHPGAARRRHDRAVRRARHARRAAHLGLGGRDGGGPDRRGGPADVRHAGPGRGRRLPRRAPRHRPRGRLAARPRRARPARGRGGEAMSDTAAPDAGTTPDAPTKGRTPLLKATDLVAGYLPGVNILSGCNLEVAKGELVGIIGPNGAGKSTLLKALFGLVNVRSGSVTLDGVDITNQKANTLVSQGVGFVPQNNNVFPSLTV